MKAHIIGSDEKAKKDLEKRGYTEVDVSFPLKAVLETLYPTVTPQEMLYKMAESAVDEYCPSLKGLVSERVMIYPDEFKNQIVLSVVLKFKKVLT